MTINNWIVNGRTNFQHANRFFQAASGNQSSVVEKEFTWNFKEH